MKRPIVIGLLLAAVLFATPVSARTPTFVTLQPGEVVTLEKELPINVVLIGFPSGAVDTAALQGALPTSSRPIVRYPAFYGLEGRDLGLNFTFDYNFHEADAVFADAFFSWLGSQGTVGEPTLFQQCYSGTAPPLPDGTPDPCNQTGNLEVIEQTRYIDGPETEKWLAKRARDQLGISPNSYTVFFVNWYSRPDFQFHVYTKTDFADPDTDYNFGEQRPSRKMIAWGGSTGRSWFFDISAGPEAKSGSYDITNPDLDGDEVPDYRIPPIWEYDAEGYRDPSELTGDLARLTRYVAINLLFATSPLYDPLVTTPGLDGSKVVSINVLQGDPGTDGRKYIDKDYLKRQLRAFQPYYDWKVDITQTKPIDPGAKRALEIFAGVTAPGPADCGFYPPFSLDDYFGELYCYFNANLNKYIPRYPTNAYIAEVFAFNTTDEIDPQGLLGFADDNWINGTQTYVFAFDSPFVRTLGYGFSTTIVHEVGHHVGMSHPHDGYDPTLGLDYGPGGETYFVWSGDESNTIMSYIDLAEGFGTFDLDNMYRYEAAGYLNRSNELLARILEHPEVERKSGQLEQAEAQATESVAFFNSWDYLRAAKRSYQAYNTLRAVARDLGVDPQPSVQLQQVRPSKPFQHPVDPVR